MSSKESLRALLESARLTGRSKERLIVSLGGLALVCTWVLLSGIIGRLLGFFVAAWVLRLGLVAIAGAAIWLFRKRPQRFFASERITEIIAIGAPGLRSAVATAAEFVGWAQTRREHQNLSPSLVAAHVEQTTQALASSGIDQRIARYYAPLEQRARRGALLAALMLVLAMAISWATYRTLFFAFFDAQDAEVSDVPLVGDLALTLRFPAYTALPPRELRGGDGTIRALKGTSVLFRAASEKSVRGAELHIGDDKTARVIPLAVENGRQLTGEFVLERSERYRVVLKPLFGSDLKERRGHSIVADEDKVPSVDIREPAQDMELRDTGRMLVSYSADDDFAVSEIALEYRVGAKNPERIVLPPPSEKTRIRGDYAFDLSPLQLKPGDVITLVLEAKDNDTISGPKVGRSRERRITVFSSDQQRRQLLQRLRQVVDKMVDQLADELENPLLKDADAYALKALPVDERGLALASELGEIGRGLKESEGDQPKFALSAERTSNELRTEYTKKKLLDAQLQKARGGPVQALAQQRQLETVQLLERAVVYFEDLRALATLEEMKAQAKELQTAHAELKQLLEQYKQTGDENLKKTLESEMGALKQKIAEMMQKMAELRRGLPQEFVNREAMERRAMENIFDRMDQMLAENRLDDLSTELERLQAQMQNMENSMKEAEDEYGGERYSELRKELQEFGQNLDAVEAAQKDVHDRTKDAEQKYREAAQKKLGQKLDDLVKQSLKDLDDAQRNFDKIAEREDRSAGILDRARNRALDARNALEQHDFMEAREMAHAAQQDVRELAQYLRAMQQMQQLTGAQKGNDASAKSAKEAEERVSEVSKRLDKLFPDPRDVLSPKELAQLDELRKRQQEIAQRTQKLGQHMKDINRQAPIFDEQAQGDMDGAKGQMDRAGQELGQQQAGRATSNQTSALQQLQKMKEAMKQRQGSGGQGMPLPMGGMPSPFGEGHDPRKQDKVEIPSGDAFKVPPEFRRDILDAMKQGTPEKFKQQVNEFYKELIK